MLNYFYVVSKDQGKTWGAPVYFRTKREAKAAAAEFVKINPAALVKIY